jgi:HEAT repeat protein
VAEEDVLARVAEVFRGGGDPDDRRWHSAALELAGRDDPRTLARIEAALDAADYDTRRAAIYVMSLRGARDSEKLIEIARSSASARDRDYALMVLSYDAPTEAAVEAVIAASVLDPNPRIRLRTREFLAFNLVGVRKHDPKPRLREFMHNRGFRQRWRAVRALRRVRKHERTLKHVN